MNGSDVVGVRSGSGARAALTLAVLAAILGLGSAVGGFVAWLGALAATGSRTDKSWFVVLLVLGLLTIGFLATLIYLVAGPPDEPAATAPSAGQVGHRKPTPIAHGAMATSVRRTTVVILLAGLTIRLASGAAGPTTAASAVPADQQAGFWLGLWQGLLIAVAFVVSLFNPDVGIYEIQNSGAWYNNLAFVLGIVAPLSGGARAGASRARSRRPRRRRATS